MGTASAHEPDEDGDVGQGSDLTCTVTFPDQEISGDTVRVEDFSLPADGYMSIHDISRFSGADVSDVEEVDELPERDNPICGSVVGITGLIPEGEYDELEVDLYTEAAPSVGEYGHFPAQSMQESQPLLAIPHINETGVDEFVCNDDPPDDGVFFNGTQTVGSIDPVVNDIATVTLESDNEGRKELAERLTQLIIDGEIAPPEENDEDDDVEEEADDEDEEKEAVDEDEEEDEEEESEKDEDQDDRDADEDEEADDEEAEDDEDDEEDEDDEDEGDEDDEEDEDDEDEGDSDEEDEKSEDEEEAEDEEETDDEDEVDGSDDEDAESGKDRGRRKKRGRFRKKRGKHD